MNIALIGLGLVSGTHVAAISNSRKGLHLSGVLARSTQKTRERAASLKNVKAYRDVGEIASDPGVDFVILATPPNARADIVDALSCAGKPILMEKPIERTLKNARDIVDLCSRRNTPLGIVFQHRARAASVALRKALNNGELGEIATVDIRVPWWRDQSYYDEPGRGSYDRDGGGAMISQAIHTLDLALWLLGPIAKVQALMRTTPLHRLQAEDWAGALFEMENGAVGSLVATTAGFPGAAESISIQGTRAAAHLASGVLSIRHLDGRMETHGASAATGGGADPMAFTHEWHQTVIEDFAHSLKTGQAPMATGHSALQSHAVIDAMERAARSGKTEQVVRI